jgi:hypothetical protein
LIQYLIEMCTTDQGLLSVIIWSDFVIAAAYFSIPVSMLVVFRNRSADIPYPSLWVAFVLFIFACGLTHLVHGVASVIRVPLLEWRAAIHLACALTSVLTAVALMIVLPKINLLPSPELQRRQLQEAVNLATRRKDALLAEVNHRMGNQLAKLGAAVRIELRAGADPANLVRIQHLLEELGEEHHRLSEMDYGEGHPARSFLRGIGQPADTRASPG